MLVVASAANAGDPAHDARAASAARPAAQTAEPVALTGSTSRSPNPSVATQLYRVVDGNHVDPNTMKGWRTWRALACERCHGANEDGLVGPSLVDDLKTMSREDFNKCVLDGRVQQGMPNFGGVKSVVENLDNLYAFLKGRSDGAIPPGHLAEIQ
jgi:hypothetical protein